MEASEAKLERLPSSAVGSYRSVSPNPDGGEPRHFWATLKRSVVNNTLVAVGLRPTREESRHWDAVKGIVLNKLQEDSPQSQDVVIQASHSTKDTPLIRHVSGYDFSSAIPAPSVVEPDGGAAPQPSLARRVTSVSGSVSGRQMSVRATGRSQVIPLEPKPDIWKLAFNSIRTLSKRKEVDVGMVAKEKSFTFMDDDKDDDVMESPLLSAKFSPIMEVDEDQFFGVEHSPIVSPRVETDSFMPSLKPDSVRREKIKNLKDFVSKLTLSGGYSRGLGGLGAVTKLLHFKYKNLPDTVQQELDAKLLHKRPYFTYWLMVVHLIIMIIALSLYGFAPYGWDLKEQRERIRQTDLSFATESKLVVPSVWLGPSQQALVLLGALFTPCMRLDRQLFQGINRDREMEANSSGCCVRRDGSGCFQAEGRSNCQERFSTFVDFDDGDIRGVCGTSPKSCLNPSPGISQGDVWVPSDILTWPVCRENDNANFSDLHLGCEITSRPCCFGIQAICMITTRDHCEFLNGRFHQDVFLCSQVSCLDEICGLLPFRKFNEPDQVYRLWIALFLHAGLIHLLLSLLFSFFILRVIEKRLGWVRTAVIYIFSGIGGNLVSAYFAPYNPEVGPAGSILGIVAYFFVFLIFESPLLRRPWIEALKLVGVSALLMVLGLIPYVDNWAHIGGFIFGFIISGILVPYGDFKEMWKLTQQKEEDFKAYFVIKLVMIFVGIPAFLLLYILFFLLLYVLQSAPAGFSFLTCVPFTDTLCIDQQVLIRDRDTFIV